MQKQKKIDLDAICKQEAAPCERREKMKMTYAEAIAEANEPRKPKEPNASQDPYAIPIEYAESAKSLVGKTLKSHDPNNNNTLKIIKWVKQNYVILVNGSDYKITPVMWVIQNLRKMEIV